uniref:NADH:flavin oxidoreductase/NADH oxidase n=1 Tax=Pelagibius sp. TaxID=1931238 RepID=UPI002631C248
MSSLFEPFTLKDVTLKNRIAVSPMCQYSADEGLVNTWHHTHLATLARGGAGLVIAEATAVSQEGRITPGCAGLWNDAQALAFAPAVRAIKAAGAVPGIQIAHAGRKASANRPWEGDDHIPEGDPRAWTPIGPSPIPFGANLPRRPRAMTKADIRRVQQDYVDAAKRAHKAGFEWLELHFAHGYLAQSFLSPHSNRRDDDYGGSFENRSRFLTETFAAVREVWPESLPLTVRLGVIEFDGREETLEESIELVRRLAGLGLDLLDVSLGFNIPDAQIPWAPGFMAPVAERVRREAKVPTATSWYISDPHQADALIREEKVDLVMLGRAL